MVGWSIKEAVTRQLLATELPALRSHQPYQPACTGATHQYVHVPALRDMRCVCGPDGVVCTNHNSQASLLTGWLRLLFFQGGGPGNIARGVCWSCWCA